MNIHTSHPSSEWTWFEARKQNKEDVPLSLQASSHRFRHGSSQHSQQNRSVHSHSLDFWVCCISFSSFMASAMSPLIFSLPIMKEVVGLALPTNMSVKRAPSIFMTQSAPPAGSPLPMAPRPFFRSKYQVPSSLPERKTWRRTWLQLLWYKEFFSRFISKQKISVNGSLSASVRVCMI